MMGSLVQIASNNIHDPLGKAIFGLIVIVLFGLLLIKMCIIDRNKPQHPGIDS